MTTATWWHAQRWNIGNSPMDRMTFEPNGRLIEAFSYSANAPRRAGENQAWQDHDGTYIARLVTEISPAFKPAISPDGTRIAAIPQGRTVRIWERGAKPPVSITRHYYRAETVTSVDLRDRIVTTGCDQKVHLLRADGTKIREFARYYSTGGSKYINSASFSPDGNSILTSSPDAVVIWGPDGNEIVLISCTGPRPRRAIFAHGKLLVTASIDKTARVWSVDGGIVANALRA